MNDAKYIGMDAHTATISAAVRDSSGNLVMEATLETKAETILEFVHGLRGSLHVSFEEGTCAAWLHDLLKPHVTEVLVCDSRKNALLRVGNKNDREDARKLSELLFLNKLHPVYHGETGIRTLKELARSYLTITRDLTRVMNRLKAIYRGWGIACAGQQVYAPRYRAEWLAKITEAGVRRRAEMCSGSRAAVSMHFVTPTRRFYLILGPRRKWFSDSFDTRMRERRSRFTAMLLEMRIVKQSRKWRRFWTLVDANRQ